MAERFQLTVPICDCQWGGTLPATWHDCEQRDGRL